MLKGNVMFVVNFDLRWYGILILEVLGIIIFMVYILFGFVCFLVVRVLFICFVFINFVFSYMRLNVMFVNKNKVCLVFGEMEVFFEFIILV